MLKVRDLLGKEILPPLSGQGQIIPENYFQGKCIFCAFQEGLKEEAVSFQPVYLHLPPQSNLIQIHGVGTGGRGVTCGRS